MKQSVFLTKMKQLGILPNSGRFFSAFSIVLLLVILNTATGCFNFHNSRIFTVDTYTNADGSLAHRLLELRKQHRYFIVYLGGDIWWLRHFELTEDNTTINGKLEILPTERYKFVNLGNKRRHKHLPKEAHVKHEVHVYASEYAITEWPEVLIPVSAISKIYVYR